MKSESNSLLASSPHPSAASRLRSSSILAGSIAMVATGGMSHAAENTWNVASGIWSATGSWTAAPATTDDAIFSSAGVGTADVTATLGANTTVNSLTFSSAGTTFITRDGSNRLMTITGASGTGITVNTGAGAVTITPGTTSSTGLKLGGSQTWTNNSSALLSVTERIYPNLTTAGTTTLTVAAPGIRRSVPVLETTAFLRTTVYSYFHSKRRVPARLHSAPAPIPTPDRC